VVFDNRKIKAYVPGFSMTVPWSEGVRLAIAWHEADPARCSVDDDANHKWDALVAAYRRAYPIEPVG
jgi:hypothetical protein